MDLGVFRASSCLARFIKVQLQNALIALIQHSGNRTRLSDEIVTGPVSRFARQIAGQGYIVAAPSSYHDFTGPEALTYDGPGTDQGNDWKVKKVYDAETIGTS